jgi:casein kinase 1 gamma
MAYETKRKQSSKNHVKKLLRLKRDTPIDVLCDGLDPVIGDYLFYTRSLKFSEKPDYDTLRDWFS